MKKSLKFLLLCLLPKSLVGTLSSIRLILSGDYLSQRRRLADNERSTSMLALYLLQQNTQEEENANDINRHELRVYSQNGEDGILFFLFSLVGTTNRQFVEFGIGNGKQCNSANLSINFGWSGLLIEADKQKAAYAQFYYQQKIGDNSQVCVIPARVTKENINNMLTANGIAGNIDLLSIDIDGNDYWVWQAINIINPRIVVIEYNASLGKTESLTVAYDPDFDRFAKHPLGFYHGASLAALTKLAQEKGYILVGCDSTGTNAFFIREDVADDKITPISISDAFFPSIIRSDSMSQAEQFQQIAHYNFEEIS